MTVQRHQFREERAAEERGHAPRALIEGGDDRTARLLLPGDELADDVCAEERLVADGQHHRPDLLATRIGGHRLDASAD
jgi:hypothetical protein